MSQHGSPHTVVRFGVFEVDLANSELRKSGVRLRLQEQPLQVLQALLERPGELVSREELIGRLWPSGTHVDFDRGLNAAVTRLRQVLSDSAETPRYIETVPKRGYRFLAPVELMSDSLPTRPENLSTAGVTPATRVEIPARSTRLRRTVLASTVLAAIVLAGLAALTQRLRETKAETKLQQLTRDVGLATEPAFSPDGRLLAYASDRGSQDLNIWVKQVVEGGQSIQLTRDEADDHQASFSPDGTKIVYRSEAEGGGIYVIPAIGGEPKRLAPGGRNPLFSPDGNWIAFWVGIVSGTAPEADAAGTVFVMPALGGEAKQLGPNLMKGGYPIWSSDSTRVLVYVNPRKGASVSEADWWIAPIDGTPAKKTGAYLALQTQGFALPFASALPRAAAWTDDNIIFSAQKGDGRNIWQVPFRRGQVSGMAHRLTEGTTLEVHPSIASPSEGKGSLAYASLNNNLAIWALPIDADKGKVTGELHRLTDGDTSEVTPSLSSDGRLLVYGSSVARQEDIWLKNLETGTRTALGTSSTGEWRPVISRDGSRVAYSMGSERSRTVVIIRSVGGQPKNAVAEGPEGGWIYDWTPDQQGLIYFTHAKPEYLLRYDTRSGVSSAFLHRPGARLYQLKFSPDLQWLTLQVVTRQYSRLFILQVRNGLPVPGTEWIPYSDESGWADKPRWSPNGNRIYFVSDRDGFRCIWSQKLDSATKRPTGNPDAIYHFHRSRLSPKNVGLGLLEMDVASDKLVVNLGELTGNIWGVSTP